MNETLLVVATLLIMLIGVVGAFLPVIPDVAIIWLAGLGYGLIHGMDWIGVVALVFMALVAVVAELSETWMTGLGARASGASLLGILVGLGLMLLGTLLTSPIAGILAGLLGMILVEYRRHRNWKKAVASATGAAAGCGLSYVVKVALSLLMIAMWGAWVWLVNVR